MSVLWRGIADVLEAIVDVAAASVHIQPERRSIADREPRHILRRAFVLIAFERPFGNLGIGIGVVQAQREVVGEPEIADKLQAAASDLGDIAGHRREFPVDVPDIFAADKILDPVIEAV